MKRRWTNSIREPFAAHESAKTTKLYDRTNDTITPDEVERIAV